MNTNQTKTALLMPDPLNNFEIKQIIMKISKDKNSKYRIQPIYIQGVLYLRKREVTTTMPIVIIIHHQQLKSF